MTLPDAADEIGRLRAESRDCLIGRVVGARMRAERAEGERDDLRDQLSAAHDEIRRLHAAGMDASGDAVDWRARAVEQEAEAARLRAELKKTRGAGMAATQDAMDWRARYREMKASNDRHHGYWIDAIRERDALQAQLDAGLDDCLEMHAAFVAVKRECDAQTQAKLLYYNRWVSAQGQLARARRWSAAWKRAAKKWWGKRGEREFDRAYEAFADSVMVRLDEMGVPRSPDETPAGFKAYYGPLRRVELLAAERDKWHAAAVQGYRLMREIDELLGDAPFTSWDDLRYVLHQYQEGRL